MTFVAISQLSVKDDTSDKLEEAFKNGIGKWIHLRDSQD
jgi:hypothetical protein